MKKLYKVVFLGYLCLLSNIIYGATYSVFETRFETMANRSDKLPPPTAKDTSSHDIRSIAPTPTAFLGHDGSASSLFKKNDAAFLTVDFTSTANANTCSNAQVDFTPQVTGVAPFTYTWDFGDGTPVSTASNPFHSFVANGCGAEVFNVTLTVSDNTGTTLSVTKPIIIQRTPIIDFRDLNNSFTPFDNCRNASASAPSYTINVGNISPSACISSFSVSWGDGTPLQTNVTFPATHTYASLGSYFMIIYAIGDNGCTATKTYIVKNVSNPSGGIISPGTTQNLCAPTAALQFAISGWGVNSPGTTYELDYGDGTIITLTQEQLMASPYYNATDPFNSLNYPVPHSYTQTSCPGNSLTAVLTIRNSCDVTTGSIANITILKKPIANFNAPAVSCSNTNILFQNTTIGGYNQNCTQELIFTWDFGDGSPIVTTPLQMPQNITHNYAAPGTYLVTLTAIGFCGQDSITKTICIEDPIAPQVTFDNLEGCTPVNLTTNNITNLTGLCSTPTYAWNVNYAAGNCGSGTPVWSYTNGTSASSPSPSFQFITPGMYTVSLVMSNTCGPGQNLTRTVIVKQPPRATINPIADSCGPVSINPSALIDSCAPASSTLTYAWNFPGGTPSTSTSANPGTISYATTGNYTVSLIVTNECGASAIATETFAVKDIPALTTTPLSQVICSGSQTSLVNLTGNFPGVTFSWTATGTAGITGFQTSGNGNTIPVQTISTSGSTAGTVTYAITTSLNGCSSPPVNYVMTVNPAPFFTSQPTGFDVCQNATAPTLSFGLNTTAGAPAYQWYSNTVNSTTGATLIPGETNTTFTPPTATVGTLYYYATVTFTSGDCPNLRTNIVRVRVLAVPTMTTQPTPSQNLCVGGAIPSALAVGYSGGFGTAAYQWYSNTTNSNSGGTLISGANSNTYLPPVFNTAGTFYYYATITLSGSGCGNLVSNVATINVVPDPVVDVQPLVTQSLCQNATPTVLSVTVSGGVGTYSYQWYRNTTNSNTGGTLIAGATNATYTPPTNTIGTRYYYVVITQTGAGCRVVSNTAQVIINTAPTLTTQPQGSTVCQNGNPTQLAVGYANGFGTPSYQWYSNTANTTVGATAISGATNSTFNPPSAVAGTLYYFVTVSFPSGGCAALTSNVVAVIIQPQATINLQPIPTQTFCVGGNVSAPLSITYTGGTGTPSYQWYSNTTNSTTGGNAISGATNSTYSPPVFTTAGTYYYYVTVSLSGNGCDPAVSTVAAIIVVNDPVVDVQPLVTQTVCQNAIPTDLSVIVSGGVGTYSYQWYSNTANNTTTGTLIAGATNSTFTPPTTAIGTRYYYVIITQTGAGCRVVSNTAEVRVNTGPAITTQPAGSTVCVGGIPAPLFVAYSNGAGTPSYQWYSNSTNSTVGATAISGATNSSFTPPSATAGTVYYFVMITFPTGGCSVLTSNIAAIIVEPQTSISVQPIPSQTFCVGGSVGAPLTVSYIGGNGTATYQWYSNTTNSTTGGILITGATNSTYTPPVFNTAGNYYYYVTITLSGNGCDPAVSSVAAIIVVNDPLVDVQPMPTQTVCQNAIPTDLSVTVSGGVGTYSYQWYSNTTNNNTTGTVIAGATNSNYTPPTNNTGTLYYYAIISQTGAGCSVKSNTAQVIVNLAPTMTTQPVGSTVCVGGTPALLTVGFANGVGTPTYQWFVNSANTTVGATPVSGETNSTFAPPSSTAGTFYYFAVITFTTGGCGNLTSDSAEVIIQPALSVTTQPMPTQTFCVGGNVSAPLSVAFTGGTGTATYQWYSNTTNSTTGGTLISGAMNSTYTPSVFNTAGTYYFYVTISLTGNGCNLAVSDVATIVVVSDPVLVVQPVSQTVCQNATPADLSVTATGGVGTYSYQWYSNATNNNVSGIPVSGETNSTFTPPTSSLGTIYYYVVVNQTGAGCSTTSTTVQVTVNSIPVLTTQPQSSTVCQGGTPTILSVGFVNGIGTPAYQWFSNTTNSTIGATPITGANSSTFAPPSATAGTLYCFVTITFPSNTGCSNLTSDIATVIIAPEAAISVQPIPVQTFCVGGSVSAPLTVSFTGGTGTASYQWYSNTTNSSVGGTAITGATNSNYMPPVFTAAGTYYYYVTISLSGNGCDPAVSNTAEIIVVNDPVVTSQPLVSQNLCEGMAPTPLSVTVSGGVGTYSYQWYSNTVDNTVSGTAITGATNSTFTPPTNAIGTVYYYCVITQTGSGCGTVSNTARVIVNPVPVITANPLSSAVCQDQAANVLFVSYANGAGIPSYQWFVNTTNSNTGGNPISGATNSSYTPPTNVAGTFYYYAVISFTSASCADLASAVATVQVNPKPVISNKTRLICSGSTFTVLPDSSTGDLVPTGTLYTWTNPIVSPAGSVTGGFAQIVPQAFLSQTLTNTTTAPGTVTYTVTPVSGGCIGTAFTVTVTVNQAINPNVTITNSTCFGVNTGAIQTNITGGVPFTTGAPYQISWIGPNGFIASTATISNLAPGNYTLSVTEAGGCPFTQSYTVLEPLDFTITTDNEKDVSCFGIANGEISITVTGGTAPYRFSWTKDSAPFSNSEDISNLSPGSYTVSILDANNCGPKTKTFTITEPTLLEVNLINQTNILCFGTSTGAINVGVVGGTPIYTFAWTGPNAFRSTNQNLTNVPAGTYNLVVTDNLGCTKPFSVTLTQAPELLVTYVTTQISCFNANNGSISVSITGGKGPYQILWSNSSTSATIQNLAPGVYRATVTDANNCSKNISVTITQPPVFTVNPVKTDVSCFGAADGTINLNFVGGVAPVTVVWDDNATAGSVRTGLAPGIYTVLVTDAQGCQISRSFTVLEPQLLALTGSTTDALACGAVNSGSISLVVIGGTTPYRYLWSNGSTSQNLTNIAPGSYAVTVTDARGCTQSRTFSVIRPQVLTINVITDTFADCDAQLVKQRFEARISGGVPPYTLAWSSGTVSGANNQFMETSQNGTVILRVTDSAGCIDQYSFNVDVPQFESPEFDVESEQFTVYGAFSVQDPILFTNNSTGDYTSITWNFGDGAVSTEENPIHVYTRPGTYLVTQTIVYPFGCTIVHKMTLEITKGYRLIPPTGFTPNGDGINDHFAPLFSGLENVEFSIYDTWGAMIYYEKGNSLKGWDGNLKNKPAENGNYYFKVAGTTFYGAIVTENGPFTLIK